MSTAMSEFEYVGSELDLFAAVRNWKEYWSATVRPFVTGDVLEVGAGLGSNTRYLDRGPRGRWVCLEPDGKLVAQMEKNLAGRYESICGTLATLDPAEKFDTLVYIDVLEHIEDDRGELEAASSRLKPGGRVIVLSPAHQRLFTPFDAAIGHYRRYSRQMLRDITPASLQIEKLIYLDCVGMMASTANLLLLRQSMPTRGQLQVWDRWMVPVSRVLDGMLMHGVGKSVVGVWRKA